MFVIAMAMLAAEVHSVAVHAIQVDLLIERLGSDLYAERQAATRALAITGPVALPALRQLLADSPDAEVRRRAAELIVRIEDQARYQSILRLVWNRRHSAQERYELRALLRPGMDANRILSMLGPAMYSVSGTGRSCEGIQHFRHDEYPEWGMAIDSSDGILTSIAEESISAYLGESRNRFDKRP
jgi:hypothetical protein